MYLQHFGLSEPPFSITPDPRFVFLSERHRDALAHLLFGVGQGGGGGFVQLTGEVGTGKTTLSRLLLEQLPDDTRVALVLNPRQDPLDLLRTVCEELGVAVAADRRDSSKALVDALNAHLLRAHADGLRVVLVIDEAQDLSVEALEQVRLLTNLETDTQKLLQVILLGQPELRDLLARADLRQLAQRITARFHLTPLAAAETADYLRHRYRVAGGTRFPFDKAAVRRIHAHAGGVPRLVNVVAERALLAGYAHDLATIDSRTVDRAASEVMPAAPRRRVGMALAAVAIVVAAVTVALAWPRGPVPTSATAAAAPLEPSLPPTAVASPVEAPVAASVPTPLPLLDASALTTTLAGVSDPSAAWATLLAAWDVDGDADSSPCRPVMEAGLYCTRGQARLDKLQTLARPAVLELATDHGPRRLLLLGVDTDRVLLQVDGERLLARRHALDAHWTGTFETIWRGPAFLAPLLESGDATGAEARGWVAERLGIPATTPAATMRDALRRFQAARGLLPDGIPGTETLMALAASDPGPHLQRTLAGD